MAALAQSTEAWPTIEEAAAQLGTSVRTMWRHAEARTVEIRKRPRPGKKPANIVNPRDLEKLMPEPYVMPTRENAGIAVRSKPSEPAWPAALESIATILSAHRDTVTIGAKLWLSLDEAAAFSGLTTAVLRNCIAYGHMKAIKGGPHGAWRIQRASLEAFAG